MEQEPAPFHEEVRQAFLELARQAPQRYLVLQADAPVEELAAQIRERVLDLLAQRASGGQRS